MRFYIFELTLCINTYNTIALSLLFKNRAQYFGCKTNISLHMLCHLYKLAIQIISMNPNAIKLLVSFQL